jgi:uncharacterized protein YndB with AHSA1/START domain
MTPLPHLPHRLDRIVTIHATPATVFRFFTDPARWASWWGAGSTIDPRPGGPLLIRYPDGTEAAGEVLELEPPARLVFTLGFVKGTPIPVGGSRVIIELQPQGTSTQLHLAHHFTDAAVRDEFTQGWRYQLALFANVIAEEVHAGAAAMVDGWFRAWAETDPAARTRALEAIAGADVRFRDRYGMTEGIADLMPHITAAQHFMPGIRLTRDGELRHCQGTVLADWIARGADGQDKARGTNLFVLGSDGRIESVTGFWGR